MIKNKSIFFKAKSASQEVGESGLAYGNATVQDLINKDTDGDGIPDWEENLWGTDPTKAETVAGVPDSTTIAKLKAQQDANSGTDASSTNQNITKTDQFSRDLFSTVSSLSENGTMDQNTADQISSSLASKIQNPVIRKVYTLADIKVTTSVTTATIQKYSNALNSAYPTTQPKYAVIDILQQITADPNNPDVSVLSELDPIIQEINNSINAMVKIPTPQTFVTLHLNVLNGFERILENLNDIQLYSTDPVVALGGISQYQTNATALLANITQLTDAINKKLSN